MKFPRLKQLDWLMTMVVFILLLIGLVVIFSSTFGAKTALEGAGTVNRQLVFVILGFVVYFVVAYIDPHFYSYFPIRAALYVVILGFLVYLWLFGDPVRNTNRWIEWGFVRIQPSEYAKVVLILINSSVLAQVLMKRGDEEVAWGIRVQRSMKEKVIYFFKNITTTYHTVYAYGIAIVLSFVFIVLIFIEPALGNASITLLICLSLYFFAFPKQKLLFGLILIMFLSANITGQLVTFSSLYKLLPVDLLVNNVDLGVTIVSVGLIFILIYVFRTKVILALMAVIIGVSSVPVTSYVWHNVLKDYHRYRIDIFLNPEKDPRGGGWQLRQARIAIGSGRLFGKGFLQGSQSKLRFLPEAYSDFIFAAFCEEFGLLGALVLLFLYAFLLVRILQAAKRSPGLYESLICVGVAMMLLIHVFINIGTNIGILPVTGIPLPLISYGGSSIMVTMIALGIVQSVNMHRDLVDTEEGLMITSECPWRDGRLK